MYLKNKNIETTLLLAFITTLSFAKGKSFEIILLTNEQVTSNSLFNIDYAFQIYLSDVLLFFLTWILIRNKNTLNKIKKFYASKSQLIFLFFIFFTIFSGLLSKFPLVSLLSSLQLVKMLIIMVIPLFLSEKPSLKKIWEIIGAVVLFQIILIILQKTNNGPLGIYIESVLPKEEFGIRSNENIDVLRSTGSFFEPSILGTFLLMQYVFLKNILNKIKINKEKIFIQLSILITITGIFFTASRGIYLVFIALTFLQEAVFIKNKTKNIYKINNKNLILYILPILIAYPYLLNRFSDFPRLFSSFGSGTYRIQMYEKAFLLAKNNIMGVGLNLSPYSYAIQKFSNEIIFDPAHPHNIFFQILAETGFIGLMIFAYFIFQAIKEIPNSYKNPFFFSIICFLASAQLYPIFINQPEIISYLFLYIGLSRIYPKI